MLCPSLLAKTGECCGVVSSKERAIYTKYFCVVLRIYVGSHSLW
jgi:hypothetical protein